jgi:hypothetical protein
LRELVMPKLIAVLFFLAICGSAFVAPNAFAGDKGTTVAADDGLAKVLKTAYKKSSDDVKLSSGKKIKTSKSLTRKSKSAKKITSLKHKLKKKSALKSKLHKKRTHKIKSAKR